MSLNTWVIMPAYNEAEHISKVIKGIKKHCKKIVVVDDGSIDETEIICKKENVFFLKHIINLGKGAALRTGCDFALKNGAKEFIVIDSDGQHDPNEIPLFIDALKKSDIVYGYRKFNTTMPFTMRLGNFVLGKSIKILFKEDLLDTQCGFRAFSSRSYRLIRWVSNDYGMESEMIANAGKSHLKYAQVPIKTIYLDGYKGTSAFDGIKILLDMIFWRLFR